MDEKEIRLRCIEAASGIIPLGPERVVDAAEQFYKFVTYQGQAAQASAKPLGLPKKN